MNLFLSNLTTEVLSIHMVDCADVSLLRKIALFDIFFPKPQFVIILSSSLKYSNDNGPDW